MAGTTIEKTPDYALRRRPEVRPRCRQRIRGCWRRCLCSTGFFFKEVQKREQSQTAAGPRQEVTSGVERFAVGTDRQRRQRVHGFIIRLNHQSMNKNSFVFSRA